MVALALFLAAGLVASTGGLVVNILPKIVSLAGCAGLALILVARAVGDFRLVGFFKRVRGSRFAKLDSLIYSPFCLALGIGVICLIMVS